MRSRPCDTVWTQSVRSALGREKFALGFEWSSYSGLSMVCLWRVSCGYQLLWLCRYCRYLRRLRQFISSRRREGMTTASRLAINSRRATASRSIPRRLGRRTWRTATDALGILTRPQLLRVRWRLVLFRAAQLFPRPLQRRLIWSVLDADTHRTDLELRLISQSIKGRLIDLTAWTSSNASARSAGSCQFRQRARKSAWVGPVPSAATEFDNLGVGTIGTLACGWIADQ
jgi:hypothetical protein